MTARKFEDTPAVRKRVPLHLSIVGPQKSGKTWSALALATGEQEVFGGDIFLLDTEGGRGQNYADYFKYRYVAFEPPHGPLDYLAAIDHCVKKGAGVVVVDSMAHEHMWILAEVERQLDEWCGEDYKARQRNTARAHIRPKAMRKVLNNAIEAYGSKLAGIFCYRAAEKLKYEAGKEPVDLGWQPDSTSTLFYAMTAAFLLPPFSNGVPDLSPENKAERIYVGLPEQFRGWFKPGMQLAAEVGERMARWALGDGASAPIAGRAVPTHTHTVDQALVAVKARFPGRSDGDARRRALAEYWNVDTPEALAGLPADRVAQGMVAFERKMPLDEYLDELDAIRQLDQETFDAGLAPEEGNAD